MVLEQGFSYTFTFNNLMSWLFYNVVSLFGSIVHYFTAETGVFLNKQAANREAINQRAEKILNDYGNNILRIAYSYLHNMSDAEEILQETLIRFLKAAPCFESQDHEKAWLLRVAVNLSKNRIDYNRIRSTDELNETLVANDQEDLSFVWNAVKDLPQKYREVIHLYYHEGYSSAQIAQIVGRKESTIRSDLRRGHAKLKEVLKEGYDYEEGIQ